MSGNNVKIGTREIGTVADSEEDNPDEIIGFLKFSTTGDVLVPREWLLDQWDAHDLPGHILPSEISHWQAYRRAISHIKENSDNLTYQVYNGEYERHFNCELEIEKSKEHGTNVYLIYAKTFFPEEVCGVDGGDQNRERVGYFDFHNPENAPGSIALNKDIDKNNVHYDHLKELFNEARGVEKDMRDHHNLQDLLGVLDDYRKVVTDSVEIRRSVYFVPAHHQNTLDALSVVWDGLNQFKEGGEEVRIDKTPVVDMKEQRELVAGRVREKLDNAVEQVINGVFSSWEDETADEIANEILNEFGENDVTETQSTYNQLLGIRLSIKDILEDMKDDVSEEREEAIQNVLDQETLGK